MAKLATIPVTVLLQTLFCGKVFSRPVKLSLVALLAGVGLATVSDVELSALGFMLAFAAVVTTAWAQILTGQLQSDLGVSSSQLLHNTSPIMAAILVVVAPPIDYAVTGQSVADASLYNPAVAAMAALSCLIAVGVNMSSFLVLGKTSAVTYQVLGHVKTCLVLIFGFVFFQSPWSVYSLSGMAIAVLGIVAYTHYAAAAAAANVAMQQKLVGPGLKSTSLYSRLTSTEDNSSIKSGGIGANGNGGSTNVPTRVPPGTVELPISIKPALVTGDRKTSPVKKKVQFEPSPMERVWSSIVESTVWSVFRREDTAEERLAAKYEKSPLMKPDGDMETSTQGINKNDKFVVEMSESDLDTLVFGGVQAVKPPFQKEKKVGNNSGRGVPAGSD
eukprot:jgi/Mesvir1/27840/Mv07516-RA.2